MVVRTAAGLSVLLANFIAACALGACTDPVERAQILVVIDADEAVRSTIDDIQAVVEVQAANGAWQTRGDAFRFEPNVLGKWPVEFSAEARTPDENLLFQVTATARDGNDALVGQARAIRKFTGETRLALRVLLEVECFRKQACLNGQTCSDGECTDAHYYGGELARNDSPLPGDPTQQGDPGQGVVNAGEGCSKEGTRGCAPAPAQVPVVCSNSVWLEQKQCEHDEMCDNAVGACKPIAHECEGRAPNVPFCEDDAMRVCKTKFLSDGLPCGQNEVCKMIGDKADCECGSGFASGPSGCEEATDCKQNRGGCDPLTECLMVDGKRACTSCPPGFGGSGVDGCEPLLEGIEPSAGTLDPVFDPNVGAYRLAVPLLVQRLTLTPTAAGDTRIRLNGADLPETGSWTTPTLPLGEYTIELSLTASSGEMREYRIVVDRSGTQEAYVKSANSSANDHFGGMVAIDGDTIVTGAPFEDSASREINGDGANDGASESGAAYVFVRREGTWSQQAYLKANDAARGDYFGTSVAIAGDTILVGAVRDNALLSSNLNSAPGVVYVFTRSGDTWTQSDRLTGTSGETADLFGWMLAIENETIVIGAPRNGSHGAAYVFARNGGKWLEQQKLDGKNLATNAMFGSAVSVSGDTIVVGAQDDDVDGTDAAGSASVFERRAGAWVETERLLPSMPVQRGSFGYSVGVQADTVMVGAPRIESIVTPFPRVSAGEVYVFDRTATGWQQQERVLKAMVPRMNDSFGSSISMRPNAALIGSCGDASGDDGVGADASRRDAEFSGAAYLYAREGQAWRPSVYLKPKNPDTNDMFGFGAGLSDEVAVVGAIWEAGSSREINGDPNNGSNMSGALYVFR